MIPLLLCLLLQDPWPMQGQNPRRTGQSPHQGPLKFGKMWTYAAEGGASINMQPVVTKDGVYFGSWGLMRREKSDPPDRWDKFDGKYFGLSFDGRELFPPLLPARTPVGYRHTGRKKLPRDVQWLGRDSDLHVSFYNGTIEGTACVDPETGLHYVGRGDGRLYAIDPKKGAVKWSFRTFNPEDPDDPDGGGEVVGGPVMTPDRAIVFGTAGAPWPDENANETHAVYAIDTNGKLLWRYPPKSARLSNPVHSPPALSPDGRTIYVTTLAGDVRTAGSLLALDGKGNLRWETKLEKIWLHHIAVGSDGTIFAGGAQAQFLGTVPVAMSFDDRGSKRWMYAPPKKAGISGGIGISDRGTIYFSTTHLRILNGVGGELYALDPRDGSLKGRFDGSPGVGGMTAPTLGSDGTIYVGIRGRHRASNGRMFALTPALEVRWSLEIDGQLDWASPAIGSNGGLFFGSSDDFPVTTQLKYFGAGEVPPDTSPKFYAVTE